MTSEAELEARRQRAARMILEGGIATPALGDDAADELLKWALAQVGQCVAATDEMGDDEANVHISAGVVKVLRLMGMINDLADQDYEMGRVEVMERLTKLLSVAMG
jgi:hypothetical protein